MNTPTKTSGIGAGKAADLTYWEGAARMIASCSTSSKIVVEKSTVPVKTAEAISKVGRVNGPRCSSYYRASLCSCRHTWRCLHLPCGCSQQVLSRQSCALPADGFAIM